jgi:hypothetical protein
LLISMQAYVKPVFSLPMLPRLWISTSSYTYRHSSRSFSLPREYTHFDAS